MHGPDEVKFVIDLFEIAEEAFKMPLKYIENWYYG